MAEKYLVECVCGGETDVPAATLGQTVECQACGGPIVVSEAVLIRRVSAAPNRETPIQTQSPPTAQTGVSASVQSAFGADDEVVEAPPKAPTRPVPVVSEPARHSPMREWDPIYRNDDVCARGGRAFRGAWDEFQTPQGAICYVCSNLAVDGEPERVRREEEARQAASRAAEEQLVVKAKADAWEAKETFLGYDTKSPQFQRVLIGAAVATLAVAYFVLVTGWGQSDVASSRGASSQSLSPEDLPKSLAWAWAAAYYCARYLVILCTIYFTLWRRNALPQETFLRNVFELSVAVAICAVVGLVTVFIASGLESGGDIGWVYPGIVYFIGFLIQGVIILTFYEWYLTDLFWGFIFYRISIFLVRSGLILVFGGLTTLVT